MDRLSFKFMDQSVANDGKIAGYGAVFGNVDSQKDRIERGAFSKSLSGRAPAMLWMHDATQPIGRWTNVSEDERGLMVEGELALKTQAGAEAYELLKMGALNGLSIGYRVVKSDVAADRVKVLKEVDLFEVSLVTFPANDLARVTGVKQRIDEIEDLTDAETLLREAGGFSRSMATGFVSSVKKIAQREAAAKQAEAEAIAAIKRAAELLRNI